MDAGSWIPLSFATFKRGTPFWGLFWKIYNALISYIASASKRARCFINH